MSSAVDQSLRTVNPVCDSIVAPSPYLFRQFNTLLTNQKAIVCSLLPANEVVRFPQVSVCHSVQEPVHHVHHWIGHMVGYFLPFPSLPSFPFH